MGEWKNRPKGYWKDWYWNRGGREKIQARRKNIVYMELKRKDYDCKTDD